MKTMKIMTIALGVAATVIGTSVHAATVVYDAGATEGDFGNPGTGSDNVAYNISVTSDNTYVYIDLSANMSQAVKDSSLDFANLYISTTAAIPGEGNTGGGHGLGFEIGNNRAFEPGVAGYFTNLSGFGVIQSNFVSPTLTTWDISVPWTYFETDPQGIGFATINSTNDIVRVNFAQAFGYSVAGTTNGFGPDELGETTFVAGASAPDAGSSMALMGLGCASLAAFARRLRK